MSPKIKRLELKKETLRDLSADGMKTVDGGFLGCVVIATLVSLSITYSVFTTQTNAETCSQYC